MKHRMFGVWSNSTLNYFRLSRIWIWLMLNWVKIYVDEYQVVMTFDVFRSI